MTLDEQIESVMKKHFQKIRDIRYMSWSERSVWISLWSLIAMVDRMLYMGMDLERIRKDVEETRWFETCETDFETILACGRARYEENKRAAVRLQATISRDVAAILKYANTEEARRAVQRVKYGETGDPVRGSAYGRGYCSVCDEPIRVCNPMEQQLCSMCLGMHKEVSSLSARKTRHHTGFLDEEGTCHW